MADLRASGGREATGGESSGGREATGGESSRDITATAGPAGGSPLIPVAAVGLLTAFALFQALATNNFPDFFIYRTGAVLGLRGESPYDIAKIRHAVADQFPDPDPKPESLVNNCGYFLPPEAVVVFAPFAAVPYPVAKVLWAIVTGASAAAVLLLLRTFGTRPPTTPIGQVVPLFLLLNFLTIGIVLVGQTTLLSVGCVAAGQWCFERRRTILGALLWAIPFIKPHVALALLPLAWYLGGWRRLAAVVIAVGLLNLAGCLIIAGSPLFLRDYLAFLGSGHKAVLFNQAERNYAITSWNRLLYVASGERLLVEQTAWITLGSYLIWFGLVVGRAWRTCGRPSAAWVAAAAAVGAVFCPQVLAYEALMLLIAVPWVRELFAGGWHIRGWAAALTLGVQAIPFETAAAVGVTVHHPLGVAVFAMLVLMGPLTPSTGCPVRDSAHPPGRRSARVGGHPPP